MYRYEACMLSVPLQNHTPLWHQQHASQQVTNAPPKKQLSSSHILSIIIYTIILIYLKYNLFFTSLVPFFYILIPFRRELIDQRQKEKENFQEI